MSNLRWVAVSSTRQAELENELAGSRWRVVVKDQPVTRGELRSAIAGAVREVVEALTPEQRAKVARHVHKSRGTPEWNLEGLLAREHEVDRAPLEWDFGDGRTRRASSRGTLAKSGRRASFTDVLADQPAKHEGDGDGRVTLPDGTIVTPDGRVHR